MKEVQIWQQELHEVIWHTAVQTKSRRGRVKGGEEKILKYKDKFTGGGKKARNNFCLRNSACFILRLRNCTVDFMVFTALSKRKMLARATSGSIQNPGSWLKTQGMGVLRLAHTHTHTPGEIFWLSAVVWLWFQLLLGLLCKGDRLWNWCGTKILPLMLEGPYSFRLESAMCIIPDRDPLLKQNLWLAILTVWATGVNGLIMSFLGITTFFLGGVKSRGNLEKRDWRKANTIHVKRK